VEQNNNDLKVGEFLIKNKIITKEQLSDALIMQNDNRDRRVGEILVTLGILTKEDLTMALEMYLILTGKESNNINEWFDQDEIDIIISNINKKNNND
jgi:hypothetical protein